MCTDHSREAPRSQSHMVGPRANGSQKPVSHGRTTRGRLLRASPPWSLTSVAMVHSSKRVSADENPIVDSSFEAAAASDVNSSSYLL
jgi:hypothetical protein